VKTKMTEGAIYNSNEALIIPFDIPTMVYLVLRHDAKEWNLAPRKVLMHLVNKASTAAAEVDDIMSATPLATSADYATKKHSIVSVVFNVDELREA
jgi:hypothetical protein